jgi:hypothetical protein
MDTFVWKQLSRINWIYHWIFWNLLYFVEYSAHFFYIENDAEIFPEYYTWKVAEKGFKMAFMMNKLAMINSCEIILEK